MATDLATLRARIDAVDDELLRLLNERAVLARKVAGLKERLQVPLHVPARERQIVDRLSARNEGPFPTEAIRPVFREVFSACRGLERAAATTARSSGRSRPRARRASP